MYIQIFVVEFNYSDLLNSGENIEIGIFFKFSNIISDIFVLENCRAVILFQAFMYLHEACRWISDTKLNFNYCTEVLNKEINVSTDYTKADALNLVASVDQEIYGNWYRTYFLKQNQKFNRE